MITQRDLDAAIAECQGKRNPDAKTCIMLAAFYTIRHEMFPEEMKSDYSFAAAPIRNTIEINSGSDFAKAINGKDQDEIFPLMDDLMNTLKIVQPRIYAAVMDRLV